MIGPGLCLTTIGVCIRLCKKFHVPITPLSRHYDVINAVLAKIACFEINFHPKGREIAKNECNSLLSKFNELSESHPRFWIISLLDRDIRDLVGVLKKGYK